MLSDLTRRLRLTLPSLQDGSLPSRFWLLARDWYGLLLSALLALATALHYVMAPEGQTPIFDDAYISLTFADNLAHHAKLSYDGVTWSTGATSPLHVSLLAAMIKAGIEPVFAGLALGVVFQSVLGASCYMLGWAVFRSRLTALLSGAAIAFIPYAPLDAGNGLETSLFLSVVTLAVASFLLTASLRGRALTGGLIALAVFTRPEGALLIPALLICRWLWRDRDEKLVDMAKEAVLIAAPGVTAAGLVALYSLVVGDTLGGTASAKMQFFQEYQWRLVDKVTFAEQRIAVFAAPMVTLIAFGAVVANRREMLLFGLFLAPLLVLHAYYFPGGMEHYFFRYQHPALPFIAVMAAGGATYLILKAATSELAVKALVLLAFVVALVPLSQQYQRWRVIYRDASNEVHALLVGMAKDLNTIIEPNETVATHDIGAVGFFGDYEVLDLVGLINPKVVPYHKDRRLAQYVDGARPDYLLMFPQWDFDFLHIYPGDYPKKYQLVRVYPGGVARVEPYLLYKIDWSQEE